MAGTGELKVVAKAILGLGNALGKALEDGKITIADSGHLLPSLMAIPGVISAFEKVGEELADLTQEEIDDLVAYCKQEFDIPQDEVETRIEEAISLAISIYNFVKSFTKPKEAPGA